MYLNKNISTITALLRYLYLVYKGIKRYIHKSLLNSSTNTNRPIMFKFTPIDMGVVMFP